MTFVLLIWIPAMLFEIRFDIGWTLWYAQLLEYACNSVFILAALCLLQAYTVDIPLSPIYQSSYFGIHDGTYTAYAPVS